MHFRKPKRPLISRRAISQPRRDASDRIDERRLEQRLPEKPMLRVGPIELQFGGVLVLILIVAAILRFAGIGWGANYYLHPDERYVTMVTTAISWPHSLSDYFNSATSPLNPYNNGQGSYLYGTFPLFLTKLIGLLTGNTVYGTAHLPGRWLSAVADVGTIAMAAWAAKMLANRLAGIFTALLLTFTALMIQTAHYATVDAVALFLVTATFTFCLYSSRRRRFGWYAMAGLMLGLAVASKPNALVTLGFLALPALEEIRLRGWQSLMPRPSRMFRSPRPAHAFPILLATLMALAIAAFTFRFTQPYAFAGPSPWSFRLDPRWTSALSYWSQMQANKLDYPPSIQWADRTPILFVIDNMVRWSMFPAFGITALVALGIAFYRILFSRRWPSWWLLGIVGWCGFHILYYGTTFVKTQRYILPAFPELAILSGILLAEMIVWARHRGDAPWISGKRLHLPRRWPKWTHPGYVLPVLVVAITAFYGVAFTNIFIQPLSRIEASAWMYKNIPAGSAITSEYWDDGLPYCIPDVDCSAYVGVQTFPYADENEGKINDLVGSLNRADYVIISSRRLVDSISRMPYRYPAATAYYKALFSGELGFDLVKTFDSPPRIGPIRINDRSSEETLTVYEHPSVYIFKKSDRWNYHTAWTYLDNAMLQSGVINLRPVQGSPSIQMLDTQGQDAYFLTGKWADIFDRFPSSITTHWPALWWYLALQLMSLPAIPLLWRLLWRLPDRGYALTKTIGLVGVSYVAWMIASLRLLPFGPIPIAIGWLVMAGLGILAIRGDRRRAWLQDMRARWLWVAGSEVIFLAVFVIAVWIRARNPDLWHPFRGGEKPMDLAYFIATIRTPYFPPYDPWFSRGTIHYYYWGLVPWAVLTRITRIVPETSYNLAIPSIFALLMLNTWSLTAAFVARMIPPSRGSVSVLRQQGRLLAYGLLGPLLVGALGNLQLIRLLGQGYQGARAKPDALTHLGGLSDYVWGFILLFISRPALPSNAFWDPTRVIPGTINEFPYFSFLFGDLHPHFLALPFLSAFLIVVVAFALSIVRPKDAFTIPADGIDGSLVGPPEPTRKPWELLASLDGWRHALTFAVVGGFLCGMLMTSNSWYYPPALALLIGVAVVTAGTQFGWSRPWLLLRDLGVFAVVLLILSRILWQPYLSHYGSLPSATEVYQGVQTTIGDFLAINSVLLFAVASYLGLELVRLISSTRQLRLEDNQQPFGAINAWFGVLLLIAGLLGAIVLNSPTVLLVAMLLVVVLVIWYRQDDRLHLVLLGMVGLGLALLLATDWIRLANDIGRMNTVFKLSLMAWVLLGAAGSVGLALVIDSFNRRSLQDPEDIAWAEHLSTGPTPGPGLTGTPSRSRKAMGIAIEIPWRAILIVLLVAAIAYPVIATPLRLKDRFTSLPPTLNGFAYLEEAQLSVATSTGQQQQISLASDLAAVKWLRDSVEGLPVLLEAHTAEYQWGGRISAMTGLPTVIGWAQQERLQRPGFEPLVNQRIADVTTIYGSLGTFESVSPLLDQYHVQLIYVGDLERATYGAEALSKFETAVNAHKLEIIYQQGGVTIYSYVPQPWPPVSPPVSPIAQVASPIASPAASPVASPVAVESPKVATPRTASSPITATPVATPAITPTTTTTSPGSPVG